VEENDGGTVACLDVSHPLVVNLNEFFGLFVGREHVYGFLIRQLGPDASLALLPELFSKGGTGTMTQQ
jgi:hypothetical protein